MWRLGCFSKEHAAVTTFHNRITHETHLWSLTLSLSVHFSIFVDWKIAAEVSFSTLPFFGVSFRFSGAEFSINVQAFLSPSPTNNVICLTWHSVGSGVPLWIPYCNLSETGASRPPGVWTIREREGWWGWNCKNCKSDFETNESKTSHGYRDTENGGFCEGRNGKKERFLNRNNRFLFKRRSFYVRVYFCVARDTFHFWKLFFFLSLFLLLGHRMCVIEREDNCIPSRLRVYWVHFILLLLARGK